MCQHIIWYVTIWVIQFISSKYYIELFCTFLYFYVIPSYRHLFPLEIIFVRWLQSSGEAMGLLAKTNQEFMKCPKRKGIWNTSRPFFFLLLMLAKNTAAEKVRWIWLSCNISTLAGPRWRTCGISRVLICGKVQRSMRFFFWMNEGRKGVFDSFWVFQSIDVLWPTKNLPLKLGTSGLYTSIFASWTSLDVVGWFCNFFELKWGISHETW